jgi:hypothetical protein
MLGSTNFPYRASADINTCRVVMRSGAFTASHAATDADEPLGISAEWSAIAPLVDLGVDATIHARSSTDDPVTIYMRGQIAQAVVGATAITAAGRVMAAADGTGKIIPFVAPGWSVGYVEDLAPVGAKTNVYIDPHFFA